MWDNTLTALVLEMQQLDLPSGLLQSQWEDFAQLLLPKLVLHMG